MFKKFGLIFMLFLSCTSMVTASTLTVDLSTVQEGCRELAHDLKGLLNLLNEICSKDPNAVYNKRTDIRKSLQRILDEVSPLQPFPDLSEATYSALIQTLNHLVHENPIVAPYVAHLWSFLSGIPVVGLRHGKDYYKMNHHLLPKADTHECAKIKIAPTIPELCVRTKDNCAEQKPNGVDHRHVKVSGELYNSALVFRKKYLSTVESAEIEEVQKTAWPLLVDELVPLEEFDAATIATFLKNSLLKMSAHKKPLYSLGIIKLFQNTAIYLSIEEGNDSDAIISPCSNDTIRYLGLQDGLFLGKGAITSEKVHELFGKQLFLRAYFKKNPCLEKDCSNECAECLTAVKAHYYPHYTFSDVNDDKKKFEELSKPGHGEALTSLMHSFMGEFSSYIKSKGRMNPLIKGLIKECDCKQLKLELSTTASLAKVLFNPTFRVELPSTVGEQPDNTMTPLSFMHLLVEHLSCKEHQATIAINLEDNKLGDREIKLLVKALQKNIVPDLAELDLAGNRITGNSLTALRSLLERDQFICLRLAANRTKCAPSNFPDALKDKIIWR